MKGKDSSPGLLVDENKYKKQKPGKKIKINGEWQDSQEYKAFHTGLQVI